MAETALGLGVVWAVASLGTLPPGGHDHADAAPIPEGAAFVHIHDVPVMADVTIDPGRVGTAAITVHVSREDFTEFPARAVQVTLAPPGAAANAVREAPAGYADGNWRIPSMDLAVAGAWTLRIMVTPVDGPPLVLDAPIVIVP
jgi:copper transport protein